MVKGWKGKVVGAAQGYGWRLRFDEAFEVWYGPVDDLASGDISCALIIGQGETEAEARADARAELTAVIDLLLPQGSPEEAVHG